MRSDLKYFNNEVKQKIININDKSFKIYDSQFNKKVIIFLPGSTGSGKVFFKYFFELQNDYRLISLDYPAYEKIDEFVSDFEKVLNELEIEKFNIVSYSHSGIIAKYILRRNISKVNNIFLLHSKTKTKDLNQNIVKAHCKNLKRTIDKHQKVFKWLFRYSTKKAIKKGIIDSEVENKKFYIRFYTNLFKNTEIEDLNNIFYLLLDFWENKYFEKDDFKKFDGRVFIGEFENEMKHLSDVQKEVLKLFSNYKRIEFKSKPEMSLVTNYDKIISIIKNNF
ncbi:MAG: alpha/beta fold hydrolase [Bacillota bacterium]